MEKFSKFAQLSHNLCRIKTLSLQPLLLLPTDIRGLFVWWKCIPSNKDLRIRSTLLPNKGRTSSKPSSETARRDQQNGADLRIPVPWKPRCWRWPPLVSKPSPSSGGWCQWPPWAPQQQHEQCHLPSVPPSQLRIISWPKHREGLCWRSCNAEMTDIAQAGACTELQGLGRSPHPPSVLGQCEAHGSHPWQVFI